MPRLSADSGREQGRICPNARQKVPQERPMVPHLRSASISDTHAALLKTCEILSRGAKVWNAAIFGVAGMTIDDAFAAARTRLSCRTLGSLLELEQDLAPRAWSGLTARLCVLACIGLQVAEEAAYPLQRHVDLCLEDLARRARA